MKIIASYAATLVFGFLFVAGCSDADEVKVVTGRELEADEDEKPVFRPTGMGGRGED